jgi:hypothetical protein
MPDKPLISAAFLCERILRETDQVLSAIRIVDTFYVTVPATLSSDVKPTLEATVFLSFSRASASGAEKHRGTFHLHKPSATGPGENPFEFDIVFNDEPVARCNVIVSLASEIAEYGLYRIDVFVDGEPRTSIPFRLLERVEPAAKK